MLLVDHLQIRKQWVMDNFEIFLGATVADAAARPLHWVYDPKKLKGYIKGKKEFAFLKKNKSPFYSIKTGNVSGYNDFSTIHSVRDITNRPLKNSSCSYYQSKKY